MSYVHEKNTFSPVGPATEVTTKTKAAPNINEGGIKRLFGYEISDVLGDYRDARKMQDETYVRVKKVALNEPFKGLKTISCHYTANKHLLYKITLESDVYAKPDVEKMKTCLMDVSEFFNDKLSDKAKMERTEKGYAARFVNCDYQTLTAEVANGTTLNGKTGKKIMISLVDSRVFRTEKSYDR